ncbi:MAG: hypothetical protein KKB25_01620 [Nanoarchaeota archaeon]|nr:hypothetical protein [Nanoarchaeota archaeon]
MVAELVYLAIAALLAPALAEMAKIRAKADKAFTWIAVGGVMFVLAASFALVDLSIVGIAASMTAPLVSLFSIVGLVAVLVGSLMASVALLKE